MKITVKEICKLIAKSKTETIENKKRFQYNIEPQQSKAFLKAIDAIIEYLK